MTAGLTSHQQRVWYRGRRLSTAEWNTLVAQHRGGDPYPQEAEVMTGETGGVHVHPLPHVELHSPTGMEWGYPGSGPADLALSILADFFGEEPAAVRAAGRTWHAEPSLAWLLHQTFKAEVVGHLTGSAWRLTGWDVQQWLDHSEHAQALLVLHWRSVAHRLEREREAAEEGSDD